MIAAQITPGNLAKKLLILFEMSLDCAAAAANGAFRPKYGFVLIPDWG